MASPRAQFLYDCQTGITNVLQFADAWSALKAEFDTFTANGVIITDADVQKILPDVTAAQFTAALTAMQEVVDYLHVATRAAKLYRIRR